MAKEKYDVFVQLRVKGGIFVDPSQNLKVVSDIPSPAIKTERVKRAIRSGHIVEVDEKTAKKKLQEVEAAKLKNLEKRTNPVVAELGQENDKLKAEIAALKKEIESLEAKASSSKKTTTTSKK